MLQRKSRWGFMVAVAAIMSLATPLNATVRDGVDAWSRGDYATAVAEWEGPAAAGDPDALFNLGQAYRLGRGVPQDLQRAEELYRRAADAGHLQAADTFGLMAFQDGRREEAMPYVVAAAGRGDPRAQYLLGVSHFNGDLVPRDWERAYALLTLANAAGLPQAGPAIAQMDVHIPLDQRQSAAGLARQLEADALSARSSQLAAADLAVQEGPAPSAGPPPRPQPSASPRVPRPIQTVAVSPSVAEARNAVEQARQATGTSSPADAGASFARAETPAPSPRESENPPPAVARSAEPAAAAAPMRTNGPWRVQLGAFGVAGNAERLWNRVSSRPEISGREQLLIPTGRVTRLQAGGYASRTEAQSACNSLRGAGIDCLVTRN